MILRITVVLVLAAACMAQKLELDLATSALLQERLQRGVVPLKKRQAAISQVFHEAGCPVEAQRVDKSFGNVICTLRGQTDSTIIVGAHYDFVERGTGIVDDWSGTALLPSLFEALKKGPRQHTFVFVAFAKEERGLIGSTLFVKKLTAGDRKNIRAFVNLECLGLTPPKVWSSRSNSELIGRLDELAKTLGILVDRVNVDKVGDDDTRPFFTARIPVISIHSITQETFGILHSSMDRLDYIQKDDYYDAFRLVAFYLAYLDMKL
ncbi:MAG: DUF4910 domain-containing protein [Acidobacteria bacterium]|nr:DUF4910 domain-containing protein [Acidobacteriota bacterium]